MGCERLLMEPWALKSEAMAQEFLQGSSNKWEGTLQRDLEQWTAERWTEVYSIQKEGKGLASRIDKYIDGKFSTLINPKDGYIVVNCVNPREKRVLEFVLPILYLEKPSRITMIVGNTIFGALSRVWKVS